MTDLNGIIEIKDFTLPAKPKRFKIDGDVFEAVSEIPIGLLGDLGDLRTALPGTSSIDQTMSMMGKVFSVILTDESCERFMARTKDKTNPIGIQHMMPVIEWLLEAYGLRPTQPSSSSSDSSDEMDDSTNSTDGASVEELTGQLTQSTESSTSSTDGS